MNAPVYIVPHELAELRAMGDELRRLCNLMDDKESERGFLANWYRSLPDDVIGARAWHEISDRQTRFRDLTTGQRYTNPTGYWDGAGRIKLSPEFRSLTGDCGAVAAWALDFMRGSLAHVWHVDYATATWVRDFFRRIVEQTEGAQDEAEHEASEAFDKCEELCAHLMGREEADFFESLDQRPRGGFNGLYQPSYKTSL
jgi:hypothetical protein